MTALGQNSGWNKHNNKEVIAGSECGRFPANIMFDEEASKILDEQSGITKSSDTKRNRNALGSFGMPNDNTPEYSDKGGASRFFYCAKTSKKDRDEGMKEFEEKKWVQFSTKNNTSGEPKNWSKDRQTSYKNIHPTVKPTKLMCYLVNLVTPKGGVVLDPFMGSGSTGKSCVQKGFDFIGIERDEEYMQIAKARIEYEQKKKYEKLF
jgi:site-specific DNA-methyltransferase (adenine-specific)